jgi:hypothetical protein
MVNLASPVVGHKGIHLQDSAAVAELGATIMSLLTKLEAD